MLFNSFEFLLGFLPVTFVLFFLIGSVSRRAGAAWLAIASLFFYGWWDPKYVLLLVASITINFSFGLALARTLGCRSDRARGQILFVAIFANLALLSYFKYAGFIFLNINTLTGAKLVIDGVILPLGISFFTFTQIAFLVDTYRGNVREFNFIHYVLFVTYFPHLIAGPVLHHKEMMPQFSQASIYRLDTESVAVGLTVFFIGLFKKVVLADGIAAYATPVFNAADAGVPLTFFEAWGGVLAYSFQIYFDFSGYSDMAVGLSRMFGVRLPINFYSPYQAHNMIEFWRRWHITLSRFLRDYLYIPLGGNRSGTVRRYVNLMVTMLLGGLWHGASWAFVIWGGLHGLYLVVNHGWHAWLRKRGRAIYPRSTWRTVSAIALTFFCVTVAWVFFRATTHTAAFDILQSMFGFRGVSLPSALVGLAPWLAMLNVRFDGMFHHGLAQWSNGMLWLGVLALITWFAPNTQQILDRFTPTLDGHTSRFGGLHWRWYDWKPHWIHAIYIAVLGVTAAACMLVGSYSEFLYFQF
jgi:D-alanyl-lipoteichoic acid acyltransferase DltB (MBOAT superfamily)